MSSYHYETSSIAFILKSLLTRRVHRIYCLDFSALCLFRLEKGLDSFQSHMMSLPAESTQPAHDDSACRIDHQLVTHSLSPPPVQPSRKSGIPQGLQQKKTPPLSESHDATDRRACKTRTPTFCARHYASPTLASPHQPSPPNFTFRQRETRNTR